MTPEERAEARCLLREIRRLNDERDCDSDARFRYVDGLKRVTPPLFLRLVPKLLDALDAAERERDEAQQIVAKQIDVWVKGASQKLIDQRDTARAQVETLAEALRKIAGTGHRCYCVTTAQCGHCQARAALTQVGLGPTAAGVEL